MGKNRRRDAPAPSAHSRIADARKLKQQAERKQHGEPSREALLLQSVASFEAGLQEELAPADREECLFDLAETLLLLAGTISKSTTFLATPFKGNITKAKFLEMQADVFTKAASFYKRSCEIYETVRTLNEFKMEATVNCANALCEWAETLLELPEAKGGGWQPALKLYADAQTRYREALSTSPDDIEVLTNLGDCMVQQAELCLQCSLWELRGPPNKWLRAPVAKPVFDEALQAYSRACSLADTKQGDDLCGLLQNWAAGLLSVAKNTPLASDSFQFFASAREKLQTATKFNSTDTSIFNALGELNIAEFERFVGTVPADQVSGWLSEAADSFKSTLKIDSSNIDALLGLAEVHTLVAKSLQSQEQAGLSTDYYVRSIELLRSGAGGVYDLNFVQQCDVLYNMACAAALCCRESDVRSALQQLVQVKAVTANELMDDGDLESLKAQQWFQALVTVASRP